VAGTGRRKRPLASSTPPLPLRDGRELSKKTYPWEGRRGEDGKSRRRSCHKGPPGTAAPLSLREAVGAEETGDRLERDQCDGAHHKKGQRYQCQQRFQADPPGTGLHIIINNHAQAIHTV
jgi:hypothetical protein